MNSTSNTGTAVGIGSAVVEISHWAIVGFPTSEAEAASIAIGAVVVYLAHVIQSIVAARFGKKDAPV